jgi:hypothetical protein
VVIEPERVRPKHHELTFVVTGAEAAPIVMIISEPATLEPAALSASTPMAASAVAAPPERANGWQGTIKLKPSQLPVEIALFADGRLHRGRLE